MFKNNLALVAAALVVTTVAAQAQALSKKTTDNPTTNGYATSGAATSDQNSTGVQSDAHKRTHSGKSNTSANNAPEIGRAHV